MSFLNRQYNSGFDKLASYYPRYYLDVREMVAILKAHGSLCDTLEDSIERVYNNNFIETMDEYMVERMATFLGLSSNSSQTIDDRRRMIKAYYIGFGTASASMIEEIFTTCTDATVDMVFEPYDEAGNNCLYITLYRDENSTVYMTDVMALVGRKIPAHIYYNCKNVILLTLEPLYPLDVLDVTDIRLSVAVSFWGSPLLNGDGYVEGSIPLDSNMLYDLIPGLLYSMGEVIHEENADVPKIQMTTALETSEDFCVDDNVTLATRVKFYECLQLDGEATLDGSQTLDVIRTEIPVTITTSADTVVV